MPIRLLRNPWTLYGISLMLIPVVAAVVAIANPQPEGACSGIGWGCSLYGWDAALFGVLFVGLPFVAVTGALVLIGWLLPPRLRFFSVAAGWLAVAGPAYVLVATLVTGGWT